MQVGQLPTALALADLNGDGIADGCDADADNDCVLNVNDCGPLNAAIKPGAAEICDGLGHGFIRYGRLVSAARRAVLALAPSFSA